MKMHIRRKRQRRPAISEQDLVDFFVCGLGIDEQGPDATAPMVFMSFSSPVMAEHENYIELSVREALKMARMLYSSAVLASPRKEVRKASALFYRPGWRARSALKPH